jgi:hypothetical protein
MINILGLFIIISDYYNQFIEYFYKKYKKCKITKKKQEFLRKAILEAGFDAEEFVSFMGRYKS